eukprot:Clim_evm11s169 gene=Clim_evmTU11s169
MKLHLRYQNKDQTTIGPWIPKTTNFGAAGVVAAAKTTTYAVNLCPMSTNQCSRRQFRDAGGVDELLQFTLLVVSLRLTPFTSRAQTV